MTSQATSGSVERELKLKLLPRDLGRVEAALVPLARRASPWRRVRTAYFDSEDLRLHAAGIALRLRHDGLARLLSVKADRVEHGGVQAARECEIACRARLPAVARIPDAALRARIDSALAGVALLRLHETDVRRRTFLVEARGAVVEVALDRGRIRAGDAAEPVCEVELELLAGDASALFDLAETLLGGLPAAPGQPSKAERGLALWARATGAMLPPAEPPPPATAADAAGRWMAACARAIGAHLFATLTDDAPEGPHQLRVWLRRLRACLWLFRPLIRPRVARDLAAMARDMARAAGAWRDADVLVGGVLLPAAREADPALAEALAAWHRRTRREARAMLVAHGATRELLELCRIVALDRWPSGGRGAPLRPPEAVAVPRLARLWERIRSEGERLASLSPEDRHALRKRIKKLRYAYEKLYGAGRDRAFGSALKRVQDSLGALNDLAVLGTFRPMLADKEMQMRLDRLLADLPGAGRHRGDLAMGRACRHWRALSALTPPWEAALPAPLPRPAARSR